MKNPVGPVLRMGDEVEQIIAAMISSTSSPIRSTGPTGFFMTPPECRTRP